MRKIIEIPVS